MSGAVALPLSEAEIHFGAAGGTTVRRTLLPSGLRVLTEHVPGAQSATVGFWIPSGSRDEAPASLGSTHFLEHLLFKGTSRRSALDIAIAFDAVGGEHNAATAKEYTCYYAKVRDLHLPMAVEVLSDMVAGSIIDPDEFETEQTTRAMWSTSGLSKPCSAHIHSVVPSAATLTPSRRRPGTA
jgi:secreted Zn-dependent insulinase-like peptidase